MFVRRLLLMLTTLLAPLVLALVAHAGGAPPQRGEIEISGTIQKILPGNVGFIVSVQKVTRPDGSVTRLNPPRPKTVLTKSLTPYLVAGDPITATGHDQTMGNLRARSVYCRRFATATETVATSPFHYKIWNPDLVAAGSLPAPWRDADIGNVGVPGSASFAKGTYTVTASGEDIYGQADSFHFVYRPLHGDGQIVARVVSYQRKDMWTKVGVMARETTDPGSKFADVLVTPDKGAEAQWRTNTNGDTQTTDQTPSPTPFWVKLTRTGDTFTSYVSADGTNWQQRGQTTVAMTPDALIGLCVTSHKNDETTTAKIDSVSVTVLPSP